LTWSRDSADDQRMPQIYELDASEIADKVRTGELRATHVLDHFLDRIDRYNEPLNAFGYLDRDGASRRAHEIDQSVEKGEDPGPLAGVPIGVKEDEACGGMPFRVGSLMLKDNIAPADSLSVARIRAAGAVIVGTTCTPEFGATSATYSPLHGVTRNPWNLECTPGGSSGGTAAAVASAMLPVGTGGDGGGSTRGPASYYGHVGL
jgi:aspartyl-tRNA(Asn)/glutamyl-tRNA(Gln) amidotransferase subunit A